MRATACRGQCALRREPSNPHFCDRHHSAPSCRALSIAHKRNCAQTDTEEQAMTLTNLNSTNLGSLFSGEVPGQTIVGHGGTQTIYGDAYLLTGRVTAHANVIWSEAGYGDGTAGSDIYGNAYIMSGYTTAGNIDYAGQRVGNAICDSHGALSHLYGNAYLMTDHASGGYNTIYARSATSWAYGDAYNINGTGVSGGHNSITFESAHGGAYGDAYSTKGT